MELINFIPQFFTKTLTLTAIIKICKLTFPENVTMKYCFPLFHSNTRVNYFHTFKGYAGQRDLSFIGVP